MKRILSSLLFIPYLTFGQTDGTPSTGESAFDTKDKTNRRVSFIIGPGASVIMSNLYDYPTINQTNNAVIIEEAPKIKTNVALGIVYTPYIFDITRTVRYIDPTGKVNSRKEIESVPKKWTYAVFINPLALSGANQTQPFFNMVDFGIGYGYRFAGGLLLMGTAEFFSVKQPRKQFIDEYKSNDKPYLIGGAAQKALDINDNSIFTNKSVITFGFKACYTFDIIKNYLSISQSIVPAPAPPAPAPPAPPAPAPPAPAP